MSETTETTQLTVSEFIAKHNITMTTESWHDNPHMERYDPRWQARHWKIVFRQGRKQLTTYFSQGLGIHHDPQPEDVLHCLASDASCVMDGQSFEDFCADLGYDDDSRQAERTYTIIRRQYRKLERFLGADALHELVYDTEPL